MTVHADNVRTAFITVREAYNAQAIIEGWLRELEDAGELSPREEEDFYYLFNHLRESIEADNIDLLERRIVKPVLQDNAAYIFKAIITWANKTCPEHFKKLRQGMN